MKYFRNTVFAASFMIGFLTMGALWILAMAAMVLSILFGKFIEFRIAHGLYIMPTLDWIENIILRIDWWAANPPLGYFRNDPRVKK